MLLYKDSVNGVMDAFNAPIRNKRVTMEKLEPHLASLLDFMDYHGLESFGDILKIDKDRLDDMIIAYLDDVHGRMVCKQCRLIWNETAEIFTRSTIFYKAMEYFCAIHRRHGPFWDYIKAKTKLEFLWYNSASGEVLGHNR